MNLMNDIDGIADFLLSAKSIDVIAHHSPDADALGSSCALILALQKIGKVCRCINETPLYYKYNFIPETQNIVNTFSKDKAEVIVVCDCGELKRVGDAFVNEVLSYATIINIDHHLSNPCFGTLNCVFEDASSTCEIVYEIIKKLEQRAAIALFNEDIATALMTGIVGDTGSFMYSSTSIKTFAIAGELMAHNVSLWQISEKLFGTNSLASVKLHAASLLEMKLHFDGKVSEVYISEETLKKYSAEQDDAEGLVEKARDVEGVVISFMIREDKGIYRISLRAKQSKHNLDVSKIALHFGGGGHKYAAGMRWKRGLEELRQTLLQRIEEQII
jgi:bifunctional oligoribonuclease and PAP phosphatase NrnA